MAVEVLDYQGFSKLRSEGDVDEEAMAVHLQSMQNLVTLLAKQQQQQQQAKQEDCSLMADATISDFKKLIALLGGSGHARFRRAPATPLSPNTSGGTAYQLNSSCSPFKHDADASPILIGTQKGHVFEPFSLCSPSKNVNGRACSVGMNDTSSMWCIPSTDTPNPHVPELNQSFSPCKEGHVDRCARAHALPLFEDQNPSVSGHARCRDSTPQKLRHQDSQAHKNMPCQMRHPFQSNAELDQAAFVSSKTNSSFLSSLSMEGGAGTVSNGKPVISSGRPPLPPKKRKSPEKIEERTMKCHNSANCHCAKRRKLKTRRVLRVSTVGLNNADIPADGYSWCQYGQKISRDSSQPRVYYKCSSVRGCSARKHVERASDDPNTLIVTYGREHLHPQIHKVLMTSE